VPIIIALNKKITTYNERNLPLTFQNKLFLPAGFAYAGRINYKRGGALSDTAKGGKEKGRG
jgi:hypothetical protein